MYQGSAEESIKRVCYCFPVLNQVHLYETNIGMETFVYMQTTGKLYLGILYRQFEKPRLQHGRLWWELILNLQTLPID